MEEIKLKLDKKLIERQLESTIKEMELIYQMEEPFPDLKIEGRKCWADARSNVGLINSCEALESIFIPYKSSNYIRNKFWTGELIDLSIIRETVRYLLIDSKKDPANSGDYKLSGTPYLDFTYKGEDPNVKSGISENFDFLDTACFMLAALLDAKLIDIDQEDLLVKGIITSKQEKLIPDALMSDWEERVSYAFKLLISCTGVGGGWTYTNDPVENNDLDYLYFTWNAIETLDVLKDFASNYKEIIPKDIIKQIPQDNLLAHIDILYIDKLSWLTARFLSPKDNPGTYIPEVIAKFGEDEDQSIYYNLFALISLMIVGCKEGEKIKDSVKNLVVNYVDKSTKLHRKIKTENYGEFELKGHNFTKHDKYWKERAFYPLQIKTLSLFMSKYQAQVTDLIEGILSYSAAKKENAEIVNDELLVNYYLQLLDECKCTHVKDMKLFNIWDSVLGSEYSVYYTQRVIESLCAIYRTYYPEEKPIMRVLGKSSEEIIVSEQTGSHKIIINIDNEVLSDTMKNKIFNEIETEIQEHVKKAKLAIEEQLSDVVEKIIKGKISGIIDDHLINTFEYIENNLYDKKPSRKYKIMAERMSKISGHCFTDIIFEALKATNHKGTEKIDRNDFKERFNELLVYMINMEVLKLPDEVLNYNDFMSKLEEAGFFAYKKQGG